MKNTTLASIFNGLGVQGLKRQIKINARLDHISFIYGPPGVGKTRIVEECAQDMGLAPITFIVSQMLPEDVGGIVAADMVNHVATRLMPDIIDAITRLGESSGKPVLAFFDEVNNGSQLMFGAMMNLLLERCAAGYCVPEGTVFIAAGNPPSVSSVAQELPAPLINRMVMIEFNGPTLEEFETYGARRNMHPAVLGMFKMDGNSKFLQHEADFDSGEPMPTPRSWESVSQFLHGYDKFKNELELNAPDRMIGVAGRVGQMAAQKMEVAIKYGDQLIPWAEIAADPSNARVPDGFVPCYMQTVLLLNNTIDFDTFKTAFAYIKRLPNEMTAVYIQPLVQNRAVFIKIASRVRELPEAAKLFGASNRLGAELGQAIASNGNSMGQTATAV